MSELWAFMQVGFRHIVDINGADHILFLLVLAAIYRGRDWRAALWVISAFTIGHSITLALAVTNLLTLPSDIVEFLIPVTIVATGIENLILQERAASGRYARHRPVLAGIFGLVHGAGFAGYLQSLFVENLAVPLLGFNLGIEAGQIVILLAAAVVFRAVDAMLTAVPSPRIAAQSYRVRMMTVSAVVVVIASGWAIQRIPQ